MCVNVCERVEHVRGSHAYVQRTDFILCECVCAYVCLCSASVVHAWCTWCMLAYSRLVRILQRTGIFELCDAPHDLSAVERQRDIEEALQILVVQLDQHHPVHLVLPKRGRMLGHP